MRTITICHQGRVVAHAGRRRVRFAAHIQTLPDGQPRKRWVCFMALYAREILTGALPGPYSHAEAERFAAACLIPDEILEILERAELDVDRERGRARAARRRRTRTPPPASRPLTAAA